MLLIHHLRRLAHRHCRRRARRTVRVTAAVTAVLTAAGVLAAVPSLINPGVSGAAAAPAGSPTGVAEHIVTAAGGIEFSGWATDPNAKPSATPVTVYLTVDGKKVTTKGASTVANRPRPDLASKTPAANGHGFDSTVVLPAGRHTLCVWATNLAGTPGANTSLRCLTETLTYSPMGAVQALSAAHGTVHVAGWAYDPDLPTTPVQVGVAVDKSVTKISAKLASAASLSSHPRGGKYHGFSVDLPAGQGKHTVCVSFTNLGRYGSNRNNVTCKTLTLNDSPTGVLDVLARSGSGIRVRGWGYDRDSPAKALTVKLTVDGVVRTITANSTRTDVGKKYPAAGAHHGFDTVLALKEGMHRICVTLVNLGPGSDRALDCRTVTLSYTPTAAITSVAATATGLTVSGWTTDPDTSAAIRAKVWVSGGVATTVLAKAKAISHSGHAFTVSFTARSGAHTVCAVGLNVGYGTHNSASACRSITLKLSPLGTFESVKRASSAGTAASAPVVVTGWALDPDLVGSSKVTVTVDGKATGTYATNVRRTDVTTRYPMVGSAAHGFSLTVPANGGEHTVCVTAVNVGGGASRSLGCKLITAIHPVAPSAVRSVTASATYGSAKITWAVPASDGGAPVSYYLVGTGTTTAKVAATARSYTATKLVAKTKYTWTVVAVNVAGASTAVTVSATTPAGPPPQTTPAPVSTSRYIRNIRGASAADLATMKREGVADARANPSGHRYLILLDIGGQDQYDGGVVLSATTRFVSYANLVTALKAYVDGYASAQKATAPITIALGTNNDIDVTAAAGKAWADSVVDKVRSYAAKYKDMAIAGANDIEPGFSGTYTQTKAWLAAYLAATTAGFVFNGSADGCAWTVTNRACNNGWSMAGLYHLAQGAAPGRMLDLPQIYNTTMAAQWKYISLTGIQSGQSRIVFGGPLTEWTACSQARSCGSLTGNNAWKEMWKNLNSDSRLKVTSLPYSTDLRIDS